MVLPTDLKALQCTLGGIQVMTVQMCLSGLACLLVTNNAMRSSNAALNFR